MKINASSQVDYLRENLSKLATDCQPLWHPLGFVSCVIRDEPRDRLVRVHYWPKDERRTKNPDWPIHTHVYDLSSLVLMGRVRDMQYRKKRGSEYAVYSVSYKDSDSSISRTGQDLSIELSVDQYHVAGQEYLVPVGSFHQTMVPPDESALTLVVLSNFQDKAPLVLGQPGNQSYPYNRIAFDRGTFWRTVEHTIAKRIS
jgi:hypothetical protein